jgi:hypothetical protein
VTSWTLLRRRRASPERCAPAPRRCCRSAPWNPGCRCSSSVSRRRARPREVRRLVWTSSIAVGSQGSGAPRAPGDTTSEVRRSAGLRRRRSLTACTDRAAPGTDGPRRVSARRSRGSCSRQFGAVKRRTEGVVIVSGPNVSYHCREWSPRLHLTIRGCVNVGHLSRA